MPPGESSDFIWLMRAAAAVHTGGDKAPHYAELLDYFKNTTAGAPPTDDGNRPYITIGRFMLDLASENEVLALANSPERTCEVAYYVGLRAELKGKYDDASDWYRMAIETGQRDTGEYRWAYDTLYRWQAKGKCLILLEAEKS